MVFDRCYIEKYEVDADQFQLTAECRGICAARCTCYSMQALCNRSRWWIRIYTFARGILTKQQLVNLTWKILQYRQQCHDFRYNKNTLASSGKSFVILATRLDRSLYRKKAIKAASDRDVSLSEAKLDKCTFCSHRVRFLAEIFKRFAYIPHLKLY